MGAAMKYSIEFQILAHGNLAVTVEWRGDWTSGSWKVKPKGGQHQVLAAKLMVYLNSRPSMHSPEIGATSDIQRYEVFRAAIDSFVDFQNVLAGEAFLKAKRFGAEPQEPEIAPPLEGVNY
jgi:hypothetical protein